MTPMKVNLSELLRLARIHIITSTEKPKIELFVDIPCKVQWENTTQ